MTMPCDTNLNSSPAPLGKLTEADLRRNHWLGEDGIEEEMIESESLLVLALYLAAFVAGLMLPAVPGWMK